MDFLKETGTSKLYTFHSHTEFCDGRAQMEAFAREAVKRGFTHYGFSPHSPVPIESPCNMKVADVDRYFAEVERIRRAYGDRCRFYAGMEIDYLGDDWGPSSPYFATLPLDYAIGSVPNHRKRPYRLSMILNSGWSFNIYSLISSGSSIYNSLSSEAPISKSSLPPSSYKRVNFIYA